MTQNATYVEIALLQSIKAIIVVLWRRNTYYYKKVFSLFVPFEIYLLREKNLEATVKDIGPQNF